MGAIFYFFGTCSSTITPTCIDLLHELSCEYSGPRLGYLSEHGILWNRAIALRCRERFLENSGAVPEFAGYSLSQV